MASVKKIGDGGSNTKALDCAGRGGVQKLDFQGGDALNSFEATCKDGTKQLIGVAAGDKKEANDCSSSGGIAGVKVDLGDWRDGPRVYGVVNKMAPICANGSSMTNSVGKAGNTTTFNCPKYETVQQITGGWGDLRLIDMVTVNCGPTMDCNKAENRNDPYCKTYCRDNPSKCDQASLAAFCQGDNLKTQQCIDFCKESPEMCDGKYAEWCKANPENYDECGCLNKKPADQKLFADLNAEGLVAFPHCIIEYCSNNVRAFKPSSAKSQRCPDQNICKLSTQAGDIIAKNGGKMNVNQSCANKTPESGGGVGNRILWIVLGVIAILCCSSCCMSSIFSWMMRQSS